MEMRNCYHKSFRVVVQVSLIKCCILSSHSIRLSFSQMMGFNFSKLFYRYHVNSSFRSEMPKLGPVVTFNLAHHAIYRKRGKMLLIITILTYRTKFRHDRDNHCVYMNVCLSKKKILKYFSYPAASDIWSALYLCLRRSSVSSVSRLRR